MARRPKNAGRKGTKKTGHLNGWMKEKVISTAPVIKKPDRFARPYKVKLANAFEAQKNYRSRHGGLYVRNAHLQQYRERDRTHKYPTGVSN